MLGGRVFQVRLARRSTSSWKASFRHLLVRGVVLGLRLRLHVRSGQRLDRPAVLHASRHAEDFTAATGRSRMLAFWLFQSAFADTCSTITSGAMVGRTGFIGDILYSIGVSGFIYPIFGHWAWGPDGWLNNIKPVPFHDFAGSTVVHTIGGFIALAGAIALGLRLGRKFKRDGGGFMQGHDMVIALYRWRHLVVRLVRLQPGQHVVGDGRRGHWSRGCQHDPCGVHWRSGRARHELPALQDLGLRPHRERLLGWVGRDHLPLLLGQPSGSAVDRRNRRSRMRVRRRAGRMAARGRPGRRGHGPRLVWHLGHAQLGLVRVRRVRRTQTTAPPTFQRPCAACSTAEGRTSWWRK